MQIEDLHEKHKLSAQDVTQLGNTLQRRTERSAGKGRSE